MLVEERRARIVRAVGSGGAVSTEELARELDVSAETIRRDLVLLDRQRRLRRVRGGATWLSATSEEEAPFAERLEAGAEAKGRIGVVAAGLVEPGQTVVLDIGTTALAAARALATAFRGTVITCSLVVAGELAGRTGVEVLVAGGRVRAGDLAVSNAQTVAFFREVHADVALLGSGGIAADAGLTDFYVDEIATRRVILANASRAYVLADASKLGKVAPYRVCALNELTGIVTDQAPPAQVARTIEGAGARLLFPG